MRFKCITLTQTCKSPIFSLKDCDLRNLQWFSSSFVVDNYCAECIYFISVLFRANIICSLERECPGSGVRALLWRGLNPSLMSDRSDNTWLEHNLHSFFRDPPDAELDSQILSWCSVHVEQKAGHVPKNLNQVACWLWTNLQVVVKAHIPQFTFASYPLWDTRLPDGTG
jgi:hypothetical protein